MVPTYVFGHLNPDTDSICAAIAYAELKQQLGYKDVVAARLGKINKETQYVLAYFKQPIPLLLSNVKPQVADLNIYRGMVMHRFHPIKKAWDHMKAEAKNMIAIVDEEEYLEGVISVSDIAKAYMELAGETFLQQYETPFRNLIEVLGGEIVQGNYPYITIRGNIYTDSTLSEEQKLNKGDIIITGHIEKLQQLALRSGAGCIIITEGKQPHMSQDIKDCAIMSVSHSFFKTIKLVNQSIPIGAIMRTKNLVYFQLEDEIGEIKEMIQSSPFRNFPVLDRAGRVRGSISRRHLIDFNRKKVILVDHNEKGQSIKGLEQAAIIEIIDHHRVADIQTMTPLYFRSEPVGCTCTIIAKMYKESGIIPSKEIAGLMLSAILSDTLMFNSPTSTEEDQHIAYELAKLAEVHIETYGMNMIVAGTSLEGKQPEEIYATDMKEFTFGKYRVMISQINTADFKTIFDIKEDLEKVMEKVCEVKSLDLALLMITDIVLGGTELMAVGDGKDLLQKAFDMSREEDSLFLPGVLSRKKQVVPKLMNASQL